MDEIIIFITCSLLVSFLIYSFYTQINSADKLKNINSFLRITFNSFLIFSIFFLLFFIIVGIFEYELATNVHKYHDLLNTLCVLLNSYIQPFLITVSILFIIIFFAKIYKRNNSIENKNSSDIIIAYKNSVNKSNFAKNIISLCITISSVFIFCLLINFFIPFALHIQNSSDYFGSVTNVKNLLDCAMLISGLLTIIFSLISILKVDYHCTTKEITYYLKYVNLITVFFIVFALVMYSYATKDISWITEFIDKAKDFK